MLCLNKEALKDKYVILDGTTPLWDIKNNEPLYNADEPALLVRDGEDVLYFGQALRADPIDDPSYGHYFFENYYKVEAQCHYHTDGIEQYSLSRLHDEEDIFVSFMAPVHYVTDPEVYQAVSLDPFAGTDKSPRTPITFWLSTMSSIRIMRTKTTWMECRRSLVFPLKLRRTSRFVLSASTKAAIRPRLFPAMNF